MSFTKLISASELANNLHQTNWVVFDTRFNLARPEARAAAYRQGHIPKAHYVHLDNDLSSPITSFTGRHPLPDLQQLAKKLGQWGVNHKLLAMEVAGLSSSKLYAGSWSEWIRNKNHAFSVQ